MQSSGYPRIDGQRRAQPAQQANPKRLKGVAVSIVEVIDTKCNLKGRNVKLTFLMKIISFWFGVSEEETERLLEDAPSAMVTTTRDVPTYIAIIASHRYRQGIKSQRYAELANNLDLQHELWSKAGAPKPVNIPKYANGRSKLLANIETFGDGTYIVIAGSRKNPCLYVFKDGEIVFSTCEDNVQHRVLSAWTTMDNDIDGEQLPAWQQERRDKARAA